MANAYDGTLLAREDAGYEQARRAAVWNARTPERYPDAIVLAGSGADVVRAVSDAHLSSCTGAGAGHIGVRSGRHSWAGNHVRDGRLLLDVSRLRDIELNVEAR
jgi:FAD/FMN-containing dehydrogenase